MPPLFNNFTTKAKEAIRRSHELAIERGQNQVSPLHLMAALLLQDDSLVFAILEKLEIDVVHLSDNIVEALEVPGSGSTMSPSFQMYLTPELAASLENAMKVAQDFQDEFISTEHLFLSLLDQRRQAPRPNGTVRNPGLRRRPAPARRARRQRLAVSSVREEQHRLEAAPSCRTRQSKRRQSGQPPIPRATANDETWRSFRKMTEDDVSTAARAVEIRRPPASEVYAELREKEMKIPHERFVGCANRFRDRAADCG